MNKTSFIVALCGLLMAPLALANDDCRQQMPSWLEQAHPGYAKQSVTLQDERGSYRVQHYKGICKRWPARPHLALVAIPLVRNVEDGYGETDLEVLVVDNRSQRIVARLVESNRLDWDAIRVDGVAFDTAPYRLNGNDIAFGIRISRRNGSGPNPFYETSLSLYELKAQRLRPLLSELVMTSSGAEWDMQCTGEFGEKAGILIVTEKQGKAGYRDLLFKRSVTSSRREGMAESCETVEEKSDQEQYRISYGEERYLLPMELSPL